MSKKRKRHDCYARASSTLGKIVDTECDVCGKPVSANRVIALLDYRFCVSCRAKLFREPELSARFPDLFAEGTAKHSSGGRVRR